MIKLPDSVLDGGHWTSPTQRVIPNREVSWRNKFKKPVLIIFQIQKPDGVVKVQIPNIIAAFESIKCQNCDKANYKFNSFRKNSHVFHFSCPICAHDKTFESSNLVMPNYKVNPDVETPRRVRLLPYLDVVAHRLIPSGGAATNNRIHAFLGEFGRNDRQFSTICRGPLLLCMIAVFKIIRNQFFEQIREQARKIDPNADGINTFYPITIIFDTRWPKKWGWDSLHSTTYVVEVTTHTVLAVITLHRKDGPGQHGTEANFDGSAPACDPEGIKRGLRAVVELGFDPIMGGHDNDSKSNKTMKKVKRELASEDAYFGKITQNIEEALCTTHGARHASKEFHAMAIEAEKAYRKRTKKAKPGLSRLFVCVFVFF